MESPQFHIAIKGLLMHNDRFLILQRPKKPHEDVAYWELPGGGLDFGEMPESVLQREVLEEINIHIKVIKPIWVWSFMKNPQMQIIGITYLCHCPNRELTLSIEHEDFAWIMPGERNQYAILPELKADMDEWERTGIFLNMTK